MPTLDWIGKKAVVNHHQDVPYRLLHCDGALSAGDPDAGNLLVEGDNLVALKALLPYYGGTVKCIYIDPPYNTGNENWVYNDNVNSPEMVKWLGQVVGKEAEDLSRHDKWLCMMYPRLRLLREFLREDGMIFVSVDENEHRYATLIMDEIFGSTNRVETLIWKKSYGGGAKSKHVVNLHEYIECFAKNLDSLHDLELPPTERVMKYYKFRDERFERRGPYRLQPLATTSMDERPNLRYPLIHESEEVWPEKQWQWERERAEKAYSNGELVFRKKGGKWSVNYKQYLKDEEGKTRGRKLYSIIEEIYTQAGTGTIRDIFGDGKAFDFPKPVDLVRDLVALSTAADSIVLDSFGGSGSTAHAVLDLNRSDGGDRRFLLVEMQNHVASTVTAERIRRVINGYTKNGNGSEKVEGLGGGFRYCTLGEPLFDADGGISPAVTFPDLAAHVFFAETGQPIPKKAHDGNPFLGTFQSRAVYLLWSREGASKPGAHKGNILSVEALGALASPGDAFSGERVVYADGCTVSRERLTRDNILFKQVPYRVAGN